MSRSGAVLAQDVRARLTAAYHRIRPLCDGLFQGADSRLEWGVPPAALRSWLLAGHLGEDAHSAVAIAYFGGRELGPLGLATVRNWVARLTRLDHQTREAVHG